MITKAIQLSVENGYKLPKDFTICEHGSFFDGGRGERGSHVMRDEVEPIIFLDPLFWQALGRGLGWVEVSEKETRQNAITGEEEEINVVNGYTWQYQWHRFIDHLIEGKTAEDFFNDLIK